MGLGIPVLSGGSLGIPSLLYLNSAQSRFGDRDSHVSPLLKEKSRKPWRGGRKGSGSGIMKLVDELSEAPECSSLSAPVGAYKRKAFPTEESPTCASFEEASFPGQ